MFSILIHCFLINILHAFDWFVLNNEDLHNFLLDAQGYNERCSSPALVSCAAITGMVTTREVGPKADGVSSRHQDSGHGASDLSQQWLHCFGI